MMMSKLMPSGGLRSAPAFARPSDAAEPRVGSGWSAGSLAMPLLRGRAPPIKASGDVSADGGGGRGRGTLGRTPTRSAKTWKSTPPAPVVEPHSGRDVVACWKLDRFARSVRHLVMALGEIGRA